MAGCGSGRTWKSAASFLLGQRGLIRQTFQPWRAYLRKDFHPSRQSSSLSAPLNVGQPPSLHHRRHTGLSLLRPKAPSFATDSIAACTQGFTALKEVAIHHRRFAASPQNSSPTGLQPLADSGPTRSTLFYRARLTDCTARFSSVHWCMEPSYSRVCLLPRISYITNQVPAARWPVLQ